MEIITQLHNECEERFHLGNEGVCLYVASYANTRFTELGYTDFRVIEGYVITIESRKHEDDWEDIRHQHTWIELSDGTVFDPSQIQFNEYGGIEDGSIEEIRSFSPTEYVNIGKRFPLNLNDKRFVKKGV